MRGAKLAQCFTIVLVDGRIPDSFMPGRLTREMSLFLLGQTLVKTLLLKNPVLLHHHA